MRLSFWADSPPNLFVISLGARLLAALYSQLDIFNAVGLDLAFPSLCTKTAYDDGIAARAWPFCVFQRPFRE